ncbi:MAG: DNA double-strand break repair nuclease NurA [Candidatus Melainabacteria bacterium]|nr:DNA double-strand break repair nuclease NurA [Candidatus Melainabacteria bacterium]
MPLDLKKLITQVKNIERQDSRDLNQQRLDSTFKVFQSALESGEHLISKLLETQSSKKSVFFFAVPESRSKKLDHIYECDKNFSLSHIVVATDGSQIVPSAHEFTSASLINIGIVSIPYFNKNIAVVLNSEPTIYNSLDEINSFSNSENVQEEDLISYERTLKEIEELVLQVKKYKSYDTPVIALLDGTFIHWHLEKFSNAFIESFIKRFSDALFELKSLNIPVASFLSNSRSNDLINMLKIYKCPYELVDCKKHCSDINSKNLPCNPMPDYKPVLDRRLVEKFLPVNQSNLGNRTVAFKSNSKILNYYPNDLKVLFFYMNTGTEIARVELPYYVASDDKLMNLLHNVLALQCKVGFGYPIVLGEAHLQAVVSKNDRRVFYDLIREQLLKNSQRPVALSSKELKKRISFV